MPASMVLPSPTSSASSTRPRNCLSTLRTVSTWYQKRLDAAQMRQAEQLVEALREAEMGEALAQAVPAAVAVRRLLHGGHQRREIELGAERDIDVDQRQGRQQQSGRRSAGAGAVGRECPAGRAVARFRSAVAWPRPASAEGRPVAPMIVSR